MYFRTAWIRKQNSLIKIDFQDNYLLDKAERGVIRKQINSADCLIEHIWQKVVKRKQTYSCRTKLYEIVQELTQVQIKQLVKVIALILTDPSSSS